MKLLNQSFEIIEQQGNDIVSALKQVELAARVCYKSEDKITDDSYLKICRMLIKKEHFSMLEHGTIYTYSNSLFDGRPNYGFSNLRDLLNMDLLFWDIDPYTVGDLEKKYRGSYRVSVKFITDRAIANEFVRHRAFAFAQESTRFCNYSNDKFGGVNFIHSSFDNKVEECEKMYLNALKEGKKPQDARDILPLTTKTELFMTGSLSDWAHFFNQRAIGTTGQPHPKAQELANGVLEEFKVRYPFIEELMEEDAIPELINDEFDKLLKLR